MKNVHHAVARINSKLHRVYRAGQMSLHLLRYQGVRALHAHASTKWQDRKYYRDLALPGGFPAEQTPSRYDVLNQKNWSEAEGYRPSFSLILPSTGHSLKSLQETVNSIKAQSYPRWNLWILNDPKTSSEIAKAVQTYVTDESRIHSVEGKPNQSPWDLWNAPIRSEPYAYAGVVHQGDRLSIDALYQVANTLVTHPELDVLYTDEIHVNPETNNLDTIQLKPDWSPEMLLGYDYLGSLSLVRQSLLVELGGYRPQHGEAHHWDLHLRLLESEAHIKRIPRCCYLRKTDREHLPSGVPRPESAAPYQKVLADSLQRQQLSADVETTENGVHRLRWRLTKRPMVSVIIPNKNNRDLIESIVNDLLYKTDYPHKEIVIVDNESTDSEVQAFYKQLQECDNVRIVPFDQDFNYSAACNAGAREAQGEILLFLNNDIEVISPDWLEEMVGWAMQPQVGVVGTKLVYPDGTLQHCGAVLGLHGFVDHIWQHVSTPEWGLFGTPDSYRNYLAVTGACQMVSRKVYDEIGGFDERYVLVGSDIMFCLRAKQQGYRVVYTPFAELIHHEGKTRKKRSPGMDLQLAASDLREMKIFEDPYNHPSISVLHASPAFRPNQERRADSFLKENINELYPMDNRFAVLNWYNDEVLNADFASRGTGLFLPNYIPHEIANDAAHATRFILHVLRQRDDLRERFPRALSDGERGGFCRWICDEGLAEYRVPAAAAEQICQVFQLNPGLKIRQVLSFRDELRNLHPLASLPTAHGEFLKWMMNHGKHEHQLADEDILWYFLESLEDPVWELEYSYRTSEELQSTFPNALTPSGCDRFLEWAKWRYRVSDEILAAFRERFVPETGTLLAASPPATAKGLNILGHFCYPSGLQQSTRSIVRSLEAMNVPLSLRDVPAHLSIDDPNRMDYLGLESHEISLVHVQPHPFQQEEYFNLAYRRAGLDPRPDVYRIGYWYWEMETPPKTWKIAAESVDELWAPTTFIAKAMQSLSKPVTTVLPGVEVGEVETVSKSVMGVDDDQYLFLYMFDVKSFIERKNPFGLIEAYKKAFRSDDRAKLVIKVSSGHFNPTEFARLQEEAAQAGVIVIDEVFSRARSYGLIQACDCYVSLHRSEGLGLTMAEAMLMGKPVIATRYSGNLDFMTDSSSLLVDHELQYLKGTCSEDVYAVYPAENFWADPNTEHAATFMRWAYDNQEEAKALGQRAKEHASHVLSPKSAGERFTAGLETIHEKIRNRDSSIPTRRAA